MKINWQPYANVTLANQGSVKTLVAHLDIKITEMTDEHVKATMPVNQTTHQPMGLLHGGASCVLSETLGSMASSMIVDLSKQYPVGLEISASHLKSAKSGLVTGICKPIKLGRKIHLWETKIYDENETLICISKLSVMILDRKKE